MIKGLGPQAGVVCILLHTSHFFFMTIQQILKQHRIEFAEYGQHHHTREGWIQLRDCPYCHSVNYHLGFNLKGRYFVCWRCGSHYGPQVFWKLGIPGAKQFFLHLKPDEDKKLLQVRKLEEPYGRLPLSDAPAHRNYLTERGFTPEYLANFWNVEAIPHTNTKLAWRLYIPVMQLGNRVSWTTRAIGSAVKQRYVSAPREKEATPIKSVVYGADFCSHTIVVCEGPTDAWAIGPGAGALFGTAFTNAQVKRLANFPYRFVCFDSSKPAQKHARDLCKLLSVFPGITQNIVLDAKDPAEASAKEIALLRKAVRL